MVRKLTIMDAFQPFLSRPYEKLHLSEISREINAPHPTARQWLNFFENKGVLRKEHKGRLTLFSLNLQNPSIVDYLVIAEKRKLIGKCEEHPMLAELVSYIHKNSNENVMVLIFGSATDSFNSANDIDALIVGKQETNELNNFSKRINKRLHIIQASRLSNITKTLKAEIISKHLLIKGSEDLIRWMVWQQ